jgi:hypothetical protein
MCLFMYISLSLADNSGSGAVRIVLLPTNEGYSGTRSKLDVGDLPGIRSPAHVAGDHAIARQHLLDYCYYYSPTYKVQAEDRNADSDGSKTCTIRAHSPSFSQR